MIRGLCARKVTTNSSPSRLLPANWVRHRIDNEAAVDAGWIGTRLRTRIRMEMAMELEKRMRMTTIMMRRCGRE